MAFFVLASVWSWLAWGLAILLGRPWADPFILVLWGLGALGPAMAASALVALGRNRRSPRWFWATVLVPRISPGMALALVGFAAGPYLVAGLLTTGGLGMRGEIQIGFLAAGLAARVAEEPGWRGYAQDQLQRRWRPLSAMLVVGIAWALWHLPLFAIEGTYQHELGIGTPGFWLFLVTLLPHAVVYGWIYLASGMSIFAVVIFHALQNGAAELLSAPGAEVAELGLISALAMALVVISRRMMLAPRRALADR